MMPSLPLWVFSFFSFLISFFYILAALGLYSSTWTSLVAVFRLICPTACGILVPRSGIEHTSPVLEGRFSTTGPAGKSPLQILLGKFWNTFWGPIINRQSGYENSMLHICKLCSSYVLKAKMQLSLSFAGFIKCILSAGGKRSGGVN